MIVWFRRVAWPLAGIAWLIAVGIGFVAMWRYAAAAGAKSSSPHYWPDDAHLVRAADRATLVMFVHPRCACSRASLADLQRLLGRVGERVKPLVVFIRPPGVAPGWEQTDLRQSAASLPNVTVVDDDGGGLARRFGAATSGATLLYDARGELLFSGGLTDVRGHPGDSFGEERMVALLTGKNADRHDSPVFGCPLEER